MTLFTTLSGKKSFILCSLLYFISNHFDFNMQNIKCLQDKNKIKCIKYKCSNITRIIVAWDNFFQLCPFNRFWRKSSLCYFFFKCHFSADVGHHWRHYWSHHWLSHFFPDFGRHSQILPFQCYFLSLSFSTKAHLPLIPLYQHFLFLKININYYYNCI